MCLHLGRLLIIPSIHPYVSKITDLTLSFYICQFNIVSQSLKHLHEGLIHNTVLLFDDAVDILTCRSNDFRKLCLGGSVLYTFDFYIYFNIGKVTVKVVPIPGVLSTSIIPSHNSTIFFTILKPNPVPYLLFRDCST